MAKKKVQEKIFNDVCINDTIYSYDMLLCNLEGYAEYSVVGIIESNEENVILKVADKDKAETELTLAKDKGHSINLAESDPYKIILAKTYFASKETLLKSLKEKAKGIKKLQGFLKKETI